MAASPLHLSGSLTRRSSPIGRIVAAASALALGFVVLSVPAPASAAGHTTRTVHLTSTADFDAGTRQGVTASNGSMTLASTPHGRKSVTDPHGSGRKTYDYGVWTSPWVTTGMDATSLIPSWNGTTSVNSFLTIQLRTKSGPRVSSWDTVTHWSSSVSTIHRYSGSSQSDDLNSLLTDTLVSNGSSRINAWQIQVIMYRVVGTQRSPVITSVSGVAANYTRRGPAHASKTSMTRTTELAVPKSSQMIHRGHRPQWGGGGEAWCSPTSTSMVMRFWNVGPRPSHYAWTGESDGIVDHTARYLYDYSYRGTGNWTFNTAYASHYGLNAFVTRLWSLTEAEKFIKDGIPLVVSIAFKRGELKGAPISSTNGHLMVITGFANDGRVIVNDPAAASASSVRRVYDRRQFEQAWLKGSGGVTYVMAPESKTLPASSGHW